MATRSKTSSARRSPVVTASPTARPAKSPVAKRPVAAAKPKAPQPARDIQPAEQPGRLRALLRWAGGPLRPVVAWAGARLRPLVRWAGGGLPFATLVVSVLGLGVSVYLTFEPKNASANCPANATFNCGRVLTSPQAHLFGQSWLSVAVVGLAFYLFIVAINSPWGWRARQPAVHWARLASVIVGIVFVLYLIYAELFLINAICLYCTAVHVLTFVLFALIVTRAAISGLRPVSPVSTVSPVSRDRERDQNS
jgi:uncharacterized membrane protein